MGSSEAVIVIPPRAAAQIAAAAQRREAAERELNAIVQIVADALEVPDGYTITGTGDGLAFVQAQPAPNDAKPLTEPGAP